MCIHDARERRAGRQSGLSLIELVMFIIIVGIAVTGVMTVFVQVSKSSADPMLRKQAIALAESLLEEVMLQPFTYCDPDDANVATATQATAGAGPTFCATDAQNLGPSPAAETRSGTPRFDNVGDYHGFSMGLGAVQDITGSPVADLATYQVAVTMAQSGATFGLPAGDVLKINVRARSSSGADVTLTGYRFRYAPNTGP
jgi:MSHA pilin protein MshD